MRVFSAMKLTHQQVRWTSGWQPSRGTLLLRRCSMSSVSMPGPSFRNDGWPLHQAGSHQVVPRGVSVKMPVGQSHGTTLSQTQAEEVHMIASCIGSRCETSLGTTGGVSYTVGWGDCPTNFQVCPTTLCPAPLTFVRCNRFLASKLTFSNAGSQIYRIRRLFGT